MNDNDNDNDNTLQIPEYELVYTYARSGGPGGQNVNKVNSKAILRWYPAANRSLPEAVRQRFLLKYGNRLSTEGELIITSQKFRDQLRNSEDCLNKLYAMLEAVRVAPIIRRPTKPSKASKERRIDCKRKDSMKKQSRKAPAAD